MRLARSWSLVLLAACWLLAALAFASSASAATPCADLRVDAIDVAPDPPIAGTFTTINITVTNGGTCTAPGFVVQWRQDQNSKTGPNRSVPSLSAGESRTVTISSEFTYPAPGNYLSRVDVDTGKAVNETNEVNNLEIRSITVVAATRNLTITNFEVTPDPKVRGRNAHAAITVQNTGNSPTGTFRVDWTPLAGAPALTTQVNGLDPGESRVVEYDYTYRRTGDVVSTATVDSTRRVAETNERDNTSTLEYVVEPPLPDLEVTDVSITPKTPVAGLVTTADVTVTNTGNDPSGAFILSWKPSLVAPALTRQVSGLEVGESETVSFDYTFLAAGTFPGTATADSTNVVREVSEANNETPTSVVVAKAGVDLTVTDIRIDCGRGGGGDGGDNGREGSCPNGQNVTQGELITAIVTVQNLGNFPSKRFTTEWNPDTTQIIPQGPNTVSLETAPLGPGESREIELPFTYPRAGNFRTLANVDAFNTNAETVETNNKRILNLVVDPAPIDLQIDSFSIAPGSPVRGVPATATITVTNYGPLATGPFSTQWKPRTNGGFPVTARSVGLNPYESQTFTLTSTYPTKGTFTSSATVDSANQVVEPFGEGNNTVTKSVTVVPQESTVNVKVNRIRVINDGDSGGFGNPQGSDAEWTPMLLAVFDPKAKCTQTFFGQAIDIAGLACKAFGRNGVNSGDILTFNPGEADIDVKLVESAPLLFAFAAIDKDNSVIGPDFPDPRGAAFKLVAKPDYLTLGTTTLKGEGCTDNDGYCFDVDIKVTVKSTNVPSTAAKAPGKPPSVVAPADAAPANKALDGFRGWYDGLAALRPAEAAR